MSNVRTASRIRSYLFGFKAINGGISMKLFSVQLGIACLLLALLSGCSGGGSSGNPPPEYGTVSLDNRSGVAIDEFYLTTAGNPSWGANHIGPGTLPTGAYYDFLDVPVGTYDARAVVVGALSIYRNDWYGIPVSANSIYTLTAFAAGFTGSIEVINNSVGANILGLYITPHSSATWGSNQISSSIAPAGSMHLYYLDPGSYDVKIVWDSGPDSLYSNQQVVSLTLWTMNVN